MKLRDWMEHYAPEQVPLEVEARARIMSAVREGLPKEHRRGTKGRFFRIGVLAAALTAALGVTAIGVGYGIWDMAREDAVMAGQSVQEYVEYQGQTAEGTYGSVKLVSCMCSGRQLSVYVELSPVTPEMREENKEFPTRQWGMDVENVWNSEAARWSWDEQGAAMDGETIGGEVVSYDEENQTELVNFVVNNGPFLHCDGAKLVFYWNQIYHSEGYDPEQPDAETGGHGKSEIWDYGTLTVPISQSEALQFDTETVVENDYIDGTATVTSASLWAGYLELQISTDSLEEWCEKHGGGEEAWFQVGDAVEGPRSEAYGYGRPTEYDAEDAQSYYAESLHKSLFAMVQEAYVTLEDGSRVTLGDVHETGGSISTGAVWSVRYELSKALELQKVESITLNGDTYSVK